MKSVRLSERMKSLRDEITCGDEIRVFTRVIMNVGSADSLLLFLFFILSSLFFKKPKEPFYHNSFIVILNGSFVILPYSGLLLIPNRFPRDLAHNHTHNLRTYYNRS